MENAEPNWLATNRTYRKCPHCRQGELDTRIRRGRFVKSFLFWLDLKRYECNSCGRKVYLAGRSKSNSPVLSAK